MRRAIILVLLLLGMQVLLPLGDRQQSQGSLLTFGFLILAAYTIGEIAAAIRLSHIVGYLLAGIVFGPEVLNVVTGTATMSLQPISRVAIALIAFLAGAELRWPEVRQRGPVILRIMSVELTLAFVALLGLIVLMRDHLPFLAGRPITQVLALSMLFAAMAIVHSPAVTMAMLTETGARGPVARTTLGIVLISDVVVVLFFAIAMAITRAVVPPSGAVAERSFLGVGWEIIGALVVGAALGAAIAPVLRYVQREIFIFSLVVAFFGNELARLAQVEGLLTLLIAGFVVQNVSANGEALRHAMERSAAPVFVVFFALAGASINLAEVVRLAPFVLPIVAVRAFALAAGTRIGARWAGAEPAVYRYSWLGLVSQAGVAFGLAALIAEVYPEHGATMRTMLLAIIAVNQMIGPILFRFALERSGELESSGEASRLETVPSPPHDASGSRC